NAPAINPANGNYVTPIAISSPPTNGIIIGGQNSPYGGQVANSNYKNFAPRVGLAWDVTGTGRTAIRAGYGIYYDSALVAPSDQNIFPNPPYVQTPTYSNASFSNVAGGSVSSITTPLALHATQIPAITPYAQQWNFTIEHRLAKDTLLSVAYV